MSAYENENESMQDLSKVGVRRAVEAAMNVTRKTVKDAAQAQRNTLHRGGDLFAAQCTLREALLAQSMANQAKSALEFDDAYALAAAEEALREAFEVRSSMPCLPPPSQASSTPVEAQAPVGAMPVEQPPVDAPVEEFVQVRVPVSQRSYVQVPVQVDTPVSQASCEQPPVEEFVPRSATPEAGRHAAVAVQPVAGPQHAASAVEEAAPARDSQNTTQPDAEYVATPTRSSHTRAARMRAARMQTAPVRDSVTHAAPAVFEPEEAAFSPEEAAPNPYVVEPSVYDAPSPRVVEASVYDAPSPHVVEASTYDAPSPNPYVVDTPNLSEVEHGAYSVAQTIPYVEPSLYNFSEQNSSFFNEPAHQASEAKDEGSSNSDVPAKKHRRDKSFTIPFGPLSEDMPANAAESLFSGAPAVQPFEAEEPIARGNHQRVTAATLIGHAFDISDATRHTSEVQPTYAASTAQPEHATAQPQSAAPQPEVAVAVQPQRAAAETPRRATAQHAAPSTSSASEGQHAPAPAAARKVDRAPAYDVQNAAIPEVPEYVASKPASKPAHIAPKKGAVPASAKARKKAEKKAAKMVISKKITAEEAPDMVKKLLAEDAAPAAETSLVPEKPHVVRRVCIALGLVVLLAAGIGIAAYFGLISLPWGLQQRVEMLPEVQAKTGSLNVSPATVAPGDYRLVLNQTPRIAAGSVECPIQFENPEGNEYNSRLVLVLADGGEQIASTHRLSPNSYVESVTLSRALEPGTYEATAVVSVLAGTTQINSMSASVTITVK